LAAPGYLTRRKLGWYFQLAIPKDLQETVGQKVVRFSLKTRDRRLASIKARDELAQATQYFAELRASRLTDEQRRSVVDKLRNLGYEINGGASDLVATISALQARERSEMDVWLEERRARLQAVDPEIDAAAAIAPLKAEGIAWLRQIDDAAETAGGKAAIEHAGLTLDDLFERWQRERKPAPRSIDECEFTVRRFRELYGRLPIADISRQQVREFREAMMKFPTRLSNEEARLPLPEILRRYERKGVPRASTVSARKRLGFLKTLLRLAVDAGDLQENPADGIRVGEVEWQQRLPFNADDLTVIFTRPPFVATGARGSIYWLMILGLYTGARLGELLQLVPADIQVADGVEFINISTEGGRRLKTESSRRRVPIHPQLKVLGFIEWVRKRDGALFADMLPAENDVQVSRDASRELNRLIRAAGIKEKRKAFHSFRHLFKDICREAGVEEAIGDALTGHAGGGVGRRYGAGFSLAVLADAVGKLRWPIDLSHLLPAEAGSDAGGARASSREGVAQRAR
jgi:integrase